MTSTGTTLVSYKTKRKMRLGAHYDSQIGLGAITAQGDLEQTTYLNLVEMQRYHARIGYVLDQMIEAQAIGFTAYTDSLGKAIDRLEAEAQPKPEPKRKRKTLPPCDLTPAQMRAAAIAEIERIKAEKARGDHK